MQNEFDGIAVYPDLQSIPKVAAFLEEKLDALEIPMKVAVRAQIALDEIYSNVVRYSGAEEAWISASVEAGQLVLSFEDNGVPFDPTTVGDPDIALSAEEREIGGLGIFMVRKAASSMDYAYKDNKNILTVRYSLQAAANKK